MRLKIFLCFCVFVFTTVSCLGSPLDLQADINGDGRVNFLDFSILASEWNMSDLSENLVAHYKMDDNAESTVVLDSSGNAYHGTSVRNTSLMHVDSPLGGELVFNGVSDYIDTGNTFQNIFRDSCTVNIYVKPYALPVEYSDPPYWFLGTDKQGVPEAAFQAQINLFGKIIFNYGVGSQGVNIVESDTLFINGENPRTMVTFVLTNNQNATAKIEMYINGILENSATFEINMSLYESDYNLCLGAANTLGSIDFFSKANLGNFMLFNKALSSSEVLTLFEETGSYYNVYRGQDGNIDYETPVATMAIDDTSVSITDQDLPPDTIWHYVRRKVSGCGLESADSPVCVVVIDSDGEMILATPNKPQNLKIEQVVGGKLRLRWRYFKTDQQIAPTGFKIYCDSGSGFDFETPVDTVTYKRAIEHSWTSDALVHGQDYKYIVQAYTTDYGQTSNTNFVAATADAVGPAAATGLSISWSED